MLVLSVKLQGKVTVKNIAHKTRKKRTYDLELQEAKCVRTTNIQDSAWKYWTREDAFSAIPQMRKQEWHKMSQNQRIECFIQTIAEGHEFEYEIIQ